MVPCNVDIVVAIASIIQNIKIKFDTEQPLLKFLSTYSARFNIVVESLVAIVIVGCHLRDMI